MPILYKYILNPLQPFQCMPRDSVVSSQKVRLDPPNLHNTFSKGMWISLHDVNMPNMECLGMYRCPLGLTLRMSRSSWSSHLPICWIGHQKQLRLPQSSSDILHLSSSKQFFLQVDPSDRIIFGTTFVGLVLVQTNLGTSLSDIARTWILDPG